VKQSLNRIKQCVSTHLCHAWGWVRKGADTLGILEYEKTGEEPSRFGEKEFQCPECSKVMHIGVKNQHLESHEENEEEKVEESPTISSSNKVKKSELLDDYEIDWERKENEKSGTEIFEGKPGKVKLV